MLKMSFQNTVAFWIVLKNRLHGILVCYLARKIPGISILSGKTAEAGERLGSTHAPINLPEGK